MGRKLRHNGATTTSIARGTTFKYDTSGNLEQVTGTVAVSYTHLTLPTMLPV